MCGGTCLAPFFKDSIKLGSLGHQALSLDCVRPSVRCFGVSLYLYRPRPRDVEPEFRGSMLRVPASFDGRPTATHIGARAAAKSLERSLHAIVVGMLLFGFGQLKPGLGVPIEAEHV